ncbi:MAG: 4-(cytidine 5'-diphospho)-2-C-methyl-D-erythritol kinase [Mycobacteriales bacterium]
MSAPRLVGVPEPVAVSAPAKVNLHLSVGDRRADGFHDLRSVFLALSLTDRVTATPARSLSLAVTGEGADGLPTDDANIACRAARLLARRTGVEPAVRLEIEKSIPVAAGLAGGSADAAATLVACDALWGTGLGRDELLEIAAEIGSDVPFALTGGTALGVGRGERLTPVLATGRWHFVLAYADGGLSTRDVYAELDRLRAKGSASSTIRPEPLLNALRSHDPGRLGALLANDLGPAARSLRPSLVRTLGEGEDIGALGAVICGSGPTCAFLARSHDAAVRLAASLAGAGVCRTVRVAHGPVPGARVAGESA